MCRPTSKRGIVKEEKNEALGEGRETEEDISEEKRDDSREKEKQLCTFGHS